jgi:hypothetical protein
MQLGTRWAAHTPEPQNLPDNVKKAIADVELELAGLPDETSAWYWTLTYLENRPVVQLDDGTTIRTDHAGIVTVTLED